MVPAKRRVEVFTAGCPVCDETVRLVKSLIGQDSDLHIYDLREGCSTNECRDKAVRYGVTAVPAVAVDETLLDCCRREPITAEALGANGIGQS